jgi:hypothetical protein
MHVTLMDDNRVSASDGTATIVLICRAFSPSGAPHPDIQTDSRFLSISFSCAGRPLALA